MTKSDVFRLSVAWLGNILQENSCFTPRYRCVLRISLQPILTSRLTATSSQKVALQRAVRRLKHRAQTTMKWGKMTEIQPWDPMKFQPLLRKSEKQTQKKWVVGCQTYPTPRMISLPSSRLRDALKSALDANDTSKVCHVLRRPASQACPAKTKIGTIVYFNDTFYASMLFLLAMPDAQQINRTAA